MRYEGKITKSGRWWAAEVPALMVYTQGRTKKEAFEMVKDAVECLVDDAGFEASVSEAEGDMFLVGGSDEHLLMALPSK